MISAHDRSTNSGRRRRAYAVITYLACVAAVAQAQNLDLSRDNGDTRRLRASMQARADELMTYQQQGQVGIDKDGRLVVRSLEGVPDLIVADLQDQLRAENADRKAYVEAMRAANGIPADKRNVVERELAKRWRAQAMDGVWIQTDEGRWVRAD